MQIIFNTTAGFLNLQEPVYRLFNDLYLKIKAIWERIEMAYHAPTQYHKKLILHNGTGNKSCSKQDGKNFWISYFEGDWAKWARSNEPKNYAQCVEPKEKVTPLHAAVATNNFSGIYHLIANKANVDAQDIRQQTPAHWSAKLGNLKGLMLLKIYGADLFLKDYRGRTPLHIAAKYGNASIITFLATQRTDRIDLNQIDKYGLTALHLAAFYGRFSLYEKLIFYGADKKIQDQFGRTAKKILELRYAENYRSRCLFSRLFTSPRPPSFRLKKEDIKDLRSV